MKKALVALAALGTCGLAAAQSSVTLFGIVDTNIAWGSGSLADRTQLTSNGTTASRFGFRGVEDLGGGLSAGFHLEAQLFTDNGMGTSSNSNNQASGGGPGLAAISFNRRSTVSLMGGFGEVRAGRDFLPQYYNIAAADTISNTGVGSGLTFTNAITGVTLIRASNAVHYFLPRDLGGFHGQVAYFVGENLSNTPSTNKDGSGGGLRFGYANGPFSGAIATGRTKYAAGDVRQSNAYVDWNFGAAKVVAGISRDRNGSLEGDGWIVGVQAPFGVHLLKAAYSRYETNCWRRFKIEPPCRLNFEPGLMANL